MKYMNGFWVPDDDHMLVLDLLGPGGAHDVDLFAEVRKYTLDQPKRVFVDVGANIGRWALHFHEDYDRVFCFEPAYYNLECLKRNTEHQTNIHLREYGLGIKKHKASLTVTKPGELACTLATELNLYYIETSVKNKVNMVNTLELLIDNIYEKKEENPNIHTVEQEKETCLLLDKQKRSTYCTNCCIC